MSTTAQGILEDVLACLAGLKEFADVSSVAAHSQNALPRACVVPLADNALPADDGPGPWQRLRLEVSLTAGGATPKAAVNRVLDLFARSRDALRADPFRGGLTRHLPCGQATAFGPGMLKCSTRPPLAELRFEVLCHYESAQPSGGQ